MTSSLIQYNIVPAELSHHSSKRACSQLFGLVNGWVLFCLFYHHADIWHLMSSLHPSTEVQKISMLPPPLYKHRTVVVCSTAILSLSLKAPSDPNKKPPPSFLMGGKRSFSKAPRTSRMISSLKLAARRVSEIVLVMYCLASCACFSGKMCRARICVSPYPF